MLPEAHWSLVTVQMDFGKRRIVTSDSCLGDDKGDAGDAEHAPYANGSVAKVCSPWRPCESRRLEIIHAFHVPFPP